MSKFWSELATTLVPYVPGEQPKEEQYIKLNTNENPYPPAPGVMEAIHAAVNSDLRLYPDLMSSKLTQTIAQRYGVKQANVFVGNGSDEVLAFAFAALFRKSAPVYFPDITYSFYPVYASFYELDTVEVPLTDEFEVPLEAFYNVGGGIIIPNPNAPTSKYVDTSLFRKVLESNPDHVVIIDEAYIDYGGESAVSLLSEYPNLLVIQTMSKSRSLAGLRVGYALGSEELIHGIDRVKNSFNSYTVDRIAEAAAVASFEDEAYFQERCTKIIATREWTTDQLSQLGFVVPESKANFLFVTHPNKTAVELHNELRAQGLYVRHFKQARIENWLRITIGTDEEMQTLVSALTKLITVS